MTNSPDYLTVDLDYLDPAGRFPRPLVAAVQVDGIQRIVFRSTIHRLLGVAALPTASVDSSQATRGFTLHAPNPPAVGALADIYRELRRTVLHILSGSAGADEMEATVSELWTRLADALIPEMDQLAQSLTVQVYRGLDFYNVLASDPPLVKVVQRAPIAAYLADQADSLKGFAHTSVDGVLEILLMQAPTPKESSKRRGTTGWYAWARRVPINDQTMPEIAHHAAVRRAAVRLADASQALTLTKVRCLAPDDWWLIHSAAMNVGAAAARIVLADPPAAAAALRAVTAATWPDPGEAWRPLYHRVLRSLGEAVRREPDRFSGMRSLAEMLAATGY